MNNPKIQSSGMATNMRLFATLVLLFVCLKASAVNMVFTIVDGNQQPITNHQCYLQPMTIPTATNNAVAIGGKLPYTTDPVTGSFTQTNPIVNCLWQLQVASPPTQTPAYFLYPANLVGNTNTFFASAYLTNYNTTNVFGPLYQVVVANGTANGQVPISTNGGSTYFWAVVSGGGGTNVANIIAGSGLAGQTNGLVITLTTNGTPLSGNGAAITNLQATNIFGAVSNALIAATSSNVVPGATFTNPTVTGAIFNTGTLYQSNRFITVPSPVLVGNSAVGLTAANGTFSWTIASGSIPSNGIGQEFLLNGNSQFTVATIVDATHFYTTSKSDSNYVNQPAILNSAPCLYLDTTGAYVAGAVDAGGSTHASANGQIGGFFLHDQFYGQNNGWTFSTTTLNTHPAFALYGWANASAIFQVDSTALFNSLTIGPEGIATRYPLINEFFGDLIIGGGASQTTNIQARGFITGSGIFLTNSLNASQGNFGSITITNLVGTASLGTGTASSTTYLRGDQTWATVAGGGITALTGDVTASGTGSVAATVASVGGKTAANVAAGIVLANSAVQPTDSRNLNLSGIISTASIVNNGQFSSDGGDVITDGNGGLSASLYTGSGAGLTLVPAASLTGSHTLPDGALSTNVPLRNANQIFGGSNNFTGSSFSGNGGGLTNLNAANLTGVQAPGTESTNDVLLNGTNVFTGSTNKFVNTTNTGTLGVAGAVTTASSLSVGTSLGVENGAAFFTISTAGTYPSGVQFINNNGSASGLHIGNPTGPVGFVVISPATYLAWTTPTNSQMTSNGVFSVARTVTATNGFTSSVSNATMFTLTMPATTVNFTNTNSVAWMYFIDNTAVTGTVVKKNGVQIYSGLSTDMSIGLRSGETFSETYTIGTPVLTGNVYP